MPVRVLIAEDHCGLRAALRALISSEADLLVTGEAADEGDLLFLAAKAPPDVVLLDIGLPGLRGFESVRTLVESLPGTRFLLLTDYEAAELLRDSLAAGAAGCVASRDAEAALATAIRTVSEGHLYIRPALLNALLCDLLPKPGHSQGQAQDLTPRETDVLRLLAGGYTNRQAAEQLGLSVRTVESHREKLMAKLGLRSRVDVVRYAAALHLSNWHD